MVKMVMMMMVKMMMMMVVMRMMRMMACSTPPDRVQMIYSDNFTKNIQETNRKIG